MKNKDSGARTGLAQATNPLSALSPVEVDRKRRRRRTNSTATNDAATSNLSVTTASTTGPPIESPVVTPTATVPAVQMSVPSTPPTSAPALPPTPVKRQHRTPSKVSVVVTEGEDSQDDSVLPDEADGHGSGSVDNESSSNKKKLVKQLDCVNAT